MKTERIARRWEDSDGQVHYVPDIIGDAYTRCERRISQYPGVWSSREVDCPTCFTAQECFPAKEIPHPVLRREAGMFVFCWPFRTTGGLMHGVVTSATRGFGQRQSLLTLCGTNTYAKLANGTGRWTHGREPLTCLGCLAVAAPRPD